MDFDDEDQTIHVQPQPEMRYASINGFVIRECIGEGGFSRVYRAYNHEGIGSVAACKVVSLYSSPTATNVEISSPDLKELEKEVQVHRVLKHQYVLEFMDSKLIKPQSVDDDGIMLVPGLYVLLELAMGGDLFDKIAPDVGIHEELAKYYFMQLASGLEFIHSKGICHRDLKPENLLLSADGDIKISDFGLCAVWKHKGKTRMLSGRCGSLPYVAPELNGYGQYHAEPVDMWGAGVVLYTMFVGNTPWDEPSKDSPEFAAYLKGDFLQYEPWAGIRGQARSLLLGLMNVDPVKRLTMEEVKRHPWLMSPSQIQRHQLPELLTQGLRSNGMWDVVEPPSTQGRRPSATQASQMMQSQFSQMDSQFMVGTGLTSTLGGSIRNYTTLSRFRLQLPVSQTYDVLNAVLADMATNSSRLVYEQRRNPDGSRGLEVSLLDNRKQPLSGSVAMEDDQDWQGVTLVLLQRSRGDPLSWKRFWWSLTKHANLRGRIIKQERR